MRCTVKKGSMPKLNLLRESEDKQMHYFVHKLILTDAWVRIALAYLICIPHTTVLASAGLGTIPPT